MAKQTIKRLFLDILICLGAIKVVDEYSSKEEMWGELQKLRQANKELDASNKYYCNLTEKLSRICYKNRYNLTEQWIDGQFNNDSHQSLVTFEPEQLPIENAKKYHISEIIDIQLLQQLFNSFYELTGIMHAFLDVDTNILSMTGWSNMCLDFHRVCTETEQRCKQSDNYIASHQQDGHYISYRCLNGLIDYATPIIVEGQHLATIFMGQVLNEPPDEEYFRRQAQEFGFEEDAYIEALHKIKIVPEHRIKPIMEFYAKLGQVLASIGLERRRKLEAINQSIKEREERLRLVLEASHDGFWDWNIETDRFYFSQRWAEILGYSQEELEPRFHKWRQRIHPDDIFATMNAFLEHLRGKTPKFEAEYRLLTKSGEWKWILDRGKVVARSKQGKPLRVAGTSNDITDRKQAETALRQSEEKFSKVFQGSPIMMTLSSLDEGIFINANEAFYAGFGYSRDEILGKPIMGEIKLFADTKERQVQEKLLIERGKVESGEIHFLTKSGEIRQGLLWSHLLNLSEKRFRITSLIDITEQRRIEHEMARLSNLNLIGEMAASIGHEIRNPMTSVRGFLQMFKNKYIEDIEHFDLMIEELDRANEIISEFLGMARNKLVYLEPQYIDQVVKAIYPMLEADANYKEMKIELKLGKPPMPVFDQNEIRQVIINLARNGLEAMLPGGTLTIGTTVEESDIVLYVQDEGSGVNPDIMDKIGTPFFTTKEKGTGLGLPVCYSIAARHNAKLEVETSPQGTTFKLRFSQPK